MIHGIYPSQLPWNPELCYCDITGRALIGHQMAALIGFWPKLCRLNHWLSAALDTDPAHLRCPTNTHTHTDVCPHLQTWTHAHKQKRMYRTSINDIQLNTLIHKNKSLNCQQLHFAPLNLSLPFICLVN